MDVPPLWMQTKVGAQKAAGFFCRHFAPGSIGPGTREKRDEPIEQGKSSSCPALFSRGELAYKYCTAIVGAGLEPQRRPLERSLDCVLVPCFSCEAGLGAGDKGEPNMRMRWRPVGTIAWLCHPHAQYYPHRKTHLDKEEDEERGRLKGRKVLLLKRKEKTACSGRLTPTIQKSRNIAGFATHAAIVVLHQLSERSERIV